MIFRLTIFLVLIISSSGLMANDEDEDQLGTWDAYMPEEDDVPINWLDNSHAYLTNQTQALAAGFNYPDYPSVFHLFSLVKKMILVKGISTVKKMTRSACNFVRRKRR